MNQNSLQNQNCFEVTTLRGSRFIYLKTVVYIKAENKSTFILLNTKELIKTSHYLKWYLKFLPEPVFYRCHNSYIINCKFVECFCNKGIILKDLNQIIPLSRIKKKTFKDNLMILDI